MEIVRINPYCVYTVLFQNKFFFLTCQLPSFIWRQKGQEELVFLFALVKLKGSYSMVELVILCLFYLQKIYKKIFLLV